MGGLSILEPNAIVAVQVGEPFKEVRMVVEQGGIAFPSIDEGRFLPGVPFKPVNHPHPVVEQGLEPEEPFIIPTP